jgi:hypothetical protein
MDNELRDYRNLAHLVFDKLWGKRGKRSRANTYLKLAYELKISPDVCHIGLFDINMCKKVIEIAERNLL